jgi:hypothetical protein
MSRTSEEIQKWHDEHYDAEIPRMHTDFDTWLLDFGEDSIFNVSFWNREEKRWSTYCSTYKIWQSVELPNGDVLIGWREYSEDSMDNSMEYHLLSESQIAFYPKEKEE